MSNEITNLDNLSSDKIMSFIGQDASVDPKLAKLSINKQSEDDAGNKLQVGTFRLDGTTAGTVIGKPILFRPLLTTYQYKKYDEDNEENNYKSVMFTSWTDPIPDTNGTQKCGSVAKADRDKLDPIEKLEQNKITCYKHTWGLATMKGLSPEGKELSVTDEPVLYTARGTNFIPIVEVLRGLSKRGKIMYNSIIEFYDTEKQTKGSNTWYIGKIRDTFKHADFTDKDKETLKGFLEIVKSENDYVLSEHNAKQKAKGEVLDDDIVAEVNTK